MDEEYIQYVKESPIYNLSMCNLENFHSCFLKWLGENYREIFYNLFDDIQINEFNNFEIRREQRHTLKDKKYIKTDLEVGNNGKCVAIIENKMKAMPDEEQLNLYSSLKNEYDDDTEFILLSLVEYNNLPKGWKNVTYSKLSSGFANHIEQIEDLYHQALVNDYIHLINYLTNKFKDLMKQEQEKYNIYDVDKEENYEIYKDIRDIYVKWRTSELANRIKEAIENDNEINKKDIKINTDFSNKTGIVNIEKTFELQNDRKVTFLIQIQANQYRYAMYGTDKEYEIANKLKDELWFGTTDGVIKDYKKARKYKNYKQDKVAKFCGYDPNFIYRYKEIATSTSYSDLCKMITDDMQLLCNNEKNIEEEIQQIFAEK